MILLQPHGDDEWEEPFPVRGVPEPFVHSVPARYLDYYTDDVTVADRRLLAEQLDEARQEAGALRNINARLKQELMESQRKLDEEASHRFLALETVAVALKEAENWRREANKAVGAVMCLEEELSAERLHYAKLRDELAGQSVAERSLAAHNETLARCFERMNAEAVALNGGIECSQVLQRLALSGTQRIANVIAGMHKWHCVVSAVNLPSRCAGDAREDSCVCWHAQVALPEDVSLQPPAQLEHLKANLADSEGATAE